jgi:hypothetical protein
MSGFAANPQLSAPLGARAGPRVANDDEAPSGIAWHRSRNDERTEATTMKVQDLIRILGDCDPEADVYVMAQRSYAFECALHGVAERRAFVETYDDDEAAASASTDADRRRTDVFLVEGSQLRYGSRDAWDAARRG